MEFGENQARAIVVILLSEVVDFFNASNTMNDSQVAITTDLIIEEYPYFKIDDLKLAFRNAMKGRYGEIYNRLDGSVIMGWLNQYNRERCAKADVISYNEHKVRVQEEYGLYYDDYRKQLKVLASHGDKSAQEALRRSDDVLSFMEEKSMSGNVTKFEIKFNKKGCLKKDEICNFFGWNNVHLTVNGHCIVSVRSDKMEAFEKTVERLFISVIKRI